MALVIAVKLSGTPSEADIQAATKIVTLENERRLTDVDGNGDPLLPPLATSPLSALADSYESMLVEILVKAHESYARQYKTEELQSAKELWQTATDAQRAAALAALES